MKSQFTFLACLTISSIATAQNLVSNGSFEQGPADGSTLSAGSTAIPGWNVTGATIDYIGTTWEAADGSFSLDMDGTPGPGGIETTIQTLPGRRYVASFQMAGNTHSPQGIKRMRISAAGFSQDFAFDTTGHDTQNMGWTRFRWVFTANSPETTLQFTSLSPNGSQDGPTLDDVTVFPQNLLLNGSFEQGPANGATLPGGSSAILGWTVSGVTIDYIGNTWEAAQGAFSLDLDGTPGPGGIQQAFATIPGERYLIRFQMAGNTHSPQGIKSMRVSAAGFSHDFHFDTTDHDAEHMGWIRNRWVFFADSPETTLQFASLGPNGSQDGPALDDVAVIQVCSGDVTDDRAVDLDDLASLLSHFGTGTGASYFDGDLDLDGDVELDDLAGMLARFGATCP